MNLSAFFLRPALFVLVSIVSYSCVAQYTNKAWLPETFLVAVERGDTAAFRHLSPIAGIMFDERGTLLISGYGAEANPVRNKKTTKAGKLTYELLYVHQHMNMMYEPQALVDSLASSLVFLSFTDNTAKLEIKHPKKISVYYFSDRFKDSVFRDIRGAQIYMAGQGKR